MMEHDASEYWGGWKATIELQRYECHALLRPIDAHSLEQTARHPRKEQIFA